MAATGYDQIRSNRREPVDFFPVYNDAKKNVPPLRDWPGFASLTFPAQ